ncbi:hypothetical protein Acr_00g0077480 [Actinidia rufa]|uniref:Uncharacterized protein n=1 Tax=Actinidia rufa TaxID=165716 RepID=A0A7J0DTU0_9ERIC|nr:hypothetical protein Acr_00g0077480 [Actinidia rufa]
MRVKTNGGPNLIGGFHFGITYWVEQEDAKGRDYGLGGKAPNGVKAAAPSFRFILMGWLTWMLSLMPWRLPVDCSRRSKEGISPERIQIPLSHLPFPSITITF